MSNLNKNNVHQGSDEPKKESNEKSTDNSIDKNIKGSEIKGNEENKTEETSPEKQTISVKEIVILFSGIIIIFIVLFTIPHIIKEEPKTIDELHIENYNQKPSDTNYIYNSFSFLKLPDPRTHRLFWNTQIKEAGLIYDLPMHYGPKELEDLDLQAINPTENRNYSMMYITVDPSNESRPYLGIAIAELTEKFSKVKKYPLVSACTENTTEGCSTRPIIDCDNAEDSIVVKIEDNKENPHVLIDGNCFIIKGKDEDLVRATDKMIYRFLGII